MVLFSPLMSFTEKMLDVTTVRHRVIADNIANVNTPGFKRSEVSFKDALERIRNSQDEGRPTGDGKHVDINDQLLQNLSLDNLYHESLAYPGDNGVTFSLADTKFDRLYGSHPAGGSTASDMDPRAQPERGLSRADIIASVQPEIVQEGGSQRKDGNNVSPEMEMSKMIKNTSFYNVLVSSISGEFRTLKTIISNR